jgi:hypothetical protein
LKFWDIDCGGSGGACPRHAELVKRTTRRDPADHIDIELWPDRRISLDAMPNPAHVQQWSVDWLGLAWLFIQRVADQDLLEFSEADARAINVAVHTSPITAARI